MKSKDELIKLGFKRSTREIYLYVDGLLTVLDPNNENHLKAREILTIEIYDKVTTEAKEYGNK